MSTLRSSIFLLLIVHLQLNAQIPIGNPVNSKINHISAYDFEVSFSKVEFASNYLVLMSTNQENNSEPELGKTYSRGDKIGNAKVVQFSNDTLISPNVIRALTTYYIVVFCSYYKQGKLNYVVSNPLKIKVSTSGLSYGNYYESISSSAPNFISSLTELINPHIVLPYSAYKSTVLQQLELHDTVAGKRFVECAYTGERKIITEPFEWTTSGYSREHTFPHSWMPTHPANDPPLPEYSDFHNLYPTNLDKANTVRNNFPLGEITGEVLYTYLGGRLGYIGNQIVYEPRDAHKGNAARAMLYMTVAYNGIKNHAWKLSVNQEQEVLKNWHVQDPPDHYEIARQEYIYSIQGNRNPFIDHPEYVCTIDFSKMVKIKGECINTQYENEMPTISISYESTILSITSDEIITGIVLSDLTGKSFNLHFLNDFHFQIENCIWNSGVYFLEITLNRREIVRRKIVLD